MMAIVWKKLDTLRESIRNIPTKRRMNQSFLLG